MNIAFNFTQRISLLVPEGFVNIPDFPNYMINNKGVVIRIYHNNTKWKEVKSNIDNKGYCVVVLRKNNKSFYIKVHRLVGKLFVPNPNNYNIINHIDEDKTNNICTNLEWCTSQYNNTYKSANNKYVLKRKKVICYDTVDNIITEYKSILDCANRFNVNSGTIMKKINTNSKWHKRYIFKYEQLSFS